MREDINLYLGGKEVEFSADPKILFNFKLTELENPTIVRNSWSKTLTIPSTAANDDIFNHFWNLERTNDYVDFNPMLKTDFELYINNTLIQKGYCKLDSVKCSKNKTEYQISLFGGLGDFFYNLSYWGGNENDDKKTLASLNYASGNGDVWGNNPNLDFTINKETVKAAWDSLMGTAVDDKWNVINFAPCYNGIPADFDADKAIVNNVGLDTMYFKNRTSGDTDTADYYQPMINGTPNLSGYTLAELREELTADETFDLRSYLNRPVINVYRTILACCNPENNGGYQVKLDSHFFHSSNPYYYGKNAWMTLPSLRDLEIDGGSQTEEITGATVTTINKNRSVVNYSTSTLSELNNVRLKVNVGLNMGSTTATTLYSYFDYSSTPASINMNYIKYATFNVGATFQLFARDNDGKICAQSKAYCLSTNQYSPNDGKTVWADFNVNGYPKPTQVVYKQGKWVKRYNQWIFCDMQGNQVDIEFTFPTSTPISSIEIISQINGGWKATRKGRWNPVNTTYYGSYDDYDEMVMWDRTSYTDSGNKTAEQIMASAVNGTFVYRITDFYGEASDYEALFSNTHISKDKLLSTSFTPAEFLISYCKLFGLYFYKDPAEVSDNPLLFPKGVIHIMDRNTFFTEEYVDLEERIDRSKDMSITPSMAGSKWYSFDVDPIDSDAQQAYKSTYGYNYGRQLVNTGYNFDSNTTNLYDGNVFKSGIMVWEKDKYFCGNYHRNPRNPGRVPNFAFNGFKNTLYHPTSGEPETYEYEVNPIGFKGGVVNPFGLKGYDTMPKLQCHSDDNSPSDGDGVLLFYKGLVQTSRFYWITDDLMEMQTLNGGNACWIMTVDENNGNGSQIAIRTNTLPQFTRDIINYGLQEGDIAHSWNFGHPQVTFSPNVYTVDGDSIYDKCWKSYIGDMYNSNGKKLTCYVNLQGIPTNAWLRKWYWFSNGIWRLNAITDYNPADPATTKCEFIKVQDVNNYKLGRIEQNGYDGIFLSRYTIEKGGGTISGVITLQNGGNWHSSGNTGMIIGNNQAGITYYEYNALQPVSGRGESTPITVTIPANTGSTPIIWSVCFTDSQNNALCATVEQDGEVGAPYLNINEPSAVIPAEGGSATITYNSGNMVESSITATLNLTWATATLDRVNKTVTLTASANTESFNNPNNPMDIRRDMLTISGYGLDNQVYSDSCQVAQPHYSGVTPYIDFTYPVIDVDANGGNIANTYVATAMQSGLTYSLSAASQWVTGISINETSKVLFATVLPNSGSARSAWITVNGLGTNGAVVNTQFRIDQQSGSQGDFQVQPNELTFDYNSTSGGNITIVCSGPWTITQQDQ